MAWPSKVDPKEIIGMTPEELKSKLEAGVTKDDLAAATGQITELKSSLTAIQDSLKALTTPKVEPTVTPSAEDVTVSLLTDPKKFLADETKDLRDAALTTQAKLQEMTARQQYGNLFGKYEKDLQEVAAKFPVSAKAQNGFWDHVVKSVLGDKVVKGELTPGTYPSLLGPSSVGPRADGSSAEPTSDFSPEVASFLKSRNVPLDKAQKIHNIMVRDGEPISHANYFGKAN